MASTKRLFVVAMDNQVEALRVAVGLTLADAQLAVAAWRSLPDDAGAQEQLEALEFGDVPVQVLPDDDPASWDALARRILDSDAVYCL